MDNIPVQLATTFREKVTIPVTCYLVLSKLGNLMGF